MKQKLNELAKQVFAQNVEAGWWDDMNRCIYQTLQLVNTEVAEATEGERKNLMDDKLKHRRMGEVELADALIRLLDLAGRYGWEIIHEDVIDEIFTHPKGIAGLHFFLTSNICRIGLLQASGAHRIQIYDMYSSTVANILEVGRRQGYDVMAAVYEKLEFNKTREDHKRSARAQEHGKKF
jgi:hypothetical protein